MRILKYIEQWVIWADQLTAFEWVLLALFVFLACTFLSFLTALLLHIYQSRDIQQRQKIQNELEPLILEALFKAPLDPGKQDILAQLPPQQVTLFMNLLLAFDQRLTGEPKEKLPGLAKPYLARYTKQTRSSDAMKRAEAIKILGTFAPDAHLQMLVQALNDPVPLVVQLAFTALCDCKNHTKHSELLGALPRLKYLSNDYISTLLSHKALHMMSSLCELLQDDKTPLNVKIIAAKTLALHHDPRALEAIRTELKHTQEAELLFPLIDFLKSAGHESDTPLLLPHLKHPHEGVRAKVLNALSNLGQTKHHDDFVLLLADPSPRVQKAAARALKQSGSLNTLKRLEKSEHPVALLAQETLQNT